MRLALQRTSGRERALVIWALALVSATILIGIASIAVIVLGLAVSWIVYALLVLVILLNASVLLLTRAHRGRLSSDSGSRR